MTFFLKMLLPRRWTGTTRDADLRRYRRIWWFSVGLTLLVSVLPLVIMAAINQRAYVRGVQAETRFEIARVLASTSRTLEFIIEERLSALKLLILERSQAELSTGDRLTTTFQNLRAAFGEFVDLGLIDASGLQVAYTGPYHLRDVNYSGQAWFNEVRVRGVHVSDVFLGYRQFPHFVIAVKHETDKGDFYILRATLNLDILSRVISIGETGRLGDVFIANQAGVLQTPSRSHGTVLEKSPLPMPPTSPRQGVIALAERSAGGVLGYAHIEKTPFVLMITAERPDRGPSWASARADLLTFLATSATLILLVVLSSLTVMVNRIRAADAHRLQALHSVEYSNKMATIGRLAASVAHEINNPLAIINEKAGLLRDVASLDEAYPHRERILNSVASIIKSVERCSNVTHRLLGFTRRLEPRLEWIDLPALLREVLEFQGKEAVHRNIEIVTDFPSDVPAIESDRGQLQQVFLNIVSNSFAALPTGGRIELALRNRPGDLVAVAVRDNGEGIAPENLRHIFEPFFSTRGEFGTGLGLSITYGLVQKLGGQIEVESELGRGTCFTVVLPVRAAESTR